MPNRRYLMITASLGFGAILLLPSLANAEDPTPTDSKQQPLAVSSPSAFKGKLVDKNTLATQRGGTDTQVFNDMRLKGVVSDNQATNVVTGHNFITDGAFTGTTGMPTVIQNSGSNVLIQNATIVNVQVQ